MAENVKPKIPTHLQKQHLGYTIAFSPSEYPPADRPEIAIVGRSNVGKSTFINKLTGFKRAHVGKKPGKTKLIGFFDVQDKYRLVDFPGYGFASRSKLERAQWMEMIEKYFSGRATLTGIILLLDCRRDWVQEEDMLLDWVNQFKRPIALILTKSDKLNRSERKKLEMKFAGEKRIQHSTFVSSLTGDGLTEAEEYIFRNFVKPHDIKESK